jgi:Protein of unknown function (DUF2505)
MSIDFSFETIFRAPSAETVLRAYFDPDHLAAQDLVGNFVGRTVTHHHEDDTMLQCSWSVSAAKPLPMYVKPFVEGGRLSFVETMKWRKADGKIDMTITPQVLGGRVGIAAVYTLTQIREGQVLRRYEGTITAAVSLLSGKVERGILDAIKEGMPGMVMCTQKWLSRGE